MTDYTPIDCNDYDFLEIACMDRYEVEVKTDSITVKGVAIQLETQCGEEFLVIRGLHGERVPVRLDRIRHLTVTTRPARFIGHSFK